MLRKLIYFYSIDENVVKQANRSTNTFDYYTDTFDVIDTILTQHGNRELVNHQHASYKQFIEKDIGDVIRQFNTRKLYFNYNPHANKYLCDYYIYNNLIYGCGKPFKIIVNGEKLIVEICDYI